MAARSQPCIRQGIKPCAVPGDGMCLPGHIDCTNSSQYSTLMINIELTLDQLKAIAGGAVMTRDRKICSECINEMPEIVFKNPKLEGLALDWWFEGEPHQSGRPEVE